MPSDYKGPISGYYETVSKYFEHKQLLGHLKLVKEIPKAHP